MKDGAAALAAALMVLARTGLEPCYRREPRLTERSIYQTSNKCRSGSHTESTTCQERRAARKAQRQARKK